MFKLVGNTGDDILYSTILWYKNRPGGAKQLQNRGKKPHTNYRYIFGSPTTRDKGNVDLKLLCGSEDLTHHRVETANQTT
jgi:hypothetical protein